MSDHANILSYLEDCKRFYKQNEYLEAAINAYWCLQYCKNGEPFGISIEMLTKAEAESYRIFLSASKKIHSASLSKTTFVYGTICPKLLWLYKNKYTLRRISDSTQKKFDYGHIIGRLAHNLFPGGIDASELSSERVIGMSLFRLPFNLKQQLWLDKTSVAIENAATYEAAFVYNDVFAAIDILTKGSYGYTAYEVKASKVITDTFIRDCALQYYVINNNVKLEDFFLIYINESYLKEINLTLEQINECNVDVDRLFLKESVLSRILPLQSFISEQISNCKSILKNREPSVDMGTQCSSPYECMFTSYCKNKEWSDFDVW